MLNYMAHGMIFHIHDTERVPDTDFHKLHIRCSGLYWQWGFQFIQMISISRDKMNSSCGTLVGTVVALMLVGDDNAVLLDPFRMAYLHE